MRRSLSIRKFVLRHFMLSSLIPTVLLSILLSAMTLFMVVRQTAQADLAALEVAARSIENRMESVAELAVRVPSIGGASTQYSSDSLYWLIANNSSENVSAIDTVYYKNYTRIRAIIDQAYLQTMSYINGIYIVRPDGFALSFGGNVVLPRTIAPLMDAIAEETELPAFIPAGMEEIYLETRSGRAYSSAYSNRNSCLTYFSRIRKLNSRQSIAVLAIDMDGSVFAPLKELSGSYGSDVYAVAADGSVIYSVGHAFEHGLYDLPVSGSSVRFDWRTGSVRCAHVLSEELGGVALCSSSSLQLFQAIEPILLVALTAGVLLVTFAALATLTSTRRLTQPVIRLSRQMVAEDALPRSITHDSDVTEFRILYDRYNEMLASISNYIDQKYANEMLLMRAKMRAMDAQISSHFLYNTLECIYTMALLDGAENVARVVKALSDMLRYISSTESATVSVRQELSYVQDYVAIQQARLGDDVHCVVAADDEILDRKMLKLSLQPLVENAFKHGFASSHHPYILHLNGELREEKLVFTVRDNGVGIPMEKLRALRRQLEEGGGSGVGLTNIAERLRVYYGRAASLSIESIPGRGTLVTMSLPEGVIE